MVAYFDCFKGTSILFSILVVLPTVSKVLFVFVFVFFLFSFSAHSPTLVVSRLFDVGHFDQGHTSLWFCLAFL